MFSKSDFYCIDGFPTEGMPAVVVLPTPLRDGYIYQGLRPAVIVFNACCIAALIVLFPLDVLIELVAFIMTINMSLFLLAFLQLRRPSQPPARRDPSVEKYETS